MDLFDMEGEVYSLLKSADALNGTTVIKAYPYLDKPVRLENTVIAVLPSQMSGEIAGIGETCQYASVDVTAAVYTPQKLGSTVLLEAAEKAVKAVLPLMPCKISLSPPAAEDRLNCLTLKVAFTFNFLAEE